MPDATPKPLPIPPITPAVRKAAGTAAARLLRALLGGESQ